MILFSSASRLVRLVQVVMLGRFTIRLFEMLRCISADRERLPVPDVDAQASEAMLFLLTSRMRRLGMLVTVDGKRLPVRAFLAA